MSRPGLQLVGVAVGVALTLTSAAGAIAYAGYREQRGRIVDDRAGLAATVGTDVGNFLIDRVDLLNTVAVSPAIRAGDAAAIRNYFGEVQRANPSIMRIAWLDADGRVRVRAPDDPRAPATLADRDYFRAVVSDGRPFVSDVFVSAVDAEPVIALAVPTRDGAGVLTGVLVAGLTLAQLDGSLAKFRSDPPVVILVADRAGRLVAGGAPGTLTDIAGQPLFLRARAEQRGVLTDAAGVRGERNQLVAFDSVPLSGWTIFVEQSDAAAFGPLRRTLTLTLSGLLLIVLAAVSGAAWAGRRLDRLAEEQQQALRESEALRDVAQLISSRLEMTEVLRLIAEEAQRLFGADFTAVATLEHDAATPVWRAVVGGHSALWQDASTVAPGVAARVALSRKPVIMTGFDPAGPDATELPIHRHEGLRTSLTVPLLSGQAIVGVLLIAWRSDRRVRDAGVQMAEALAASAAVSIENARLYDETRRAIGVRDEFLASASHELRTPLSHIKGFVGTLRQTDLADDPETLQDFLAEIEREADRLARLVDDLLDISRIESGAHQRDRRPARLRTVALFGLDRVRNLLGDRPVRVDVPAELPPVAMNAPEIERVIANLLENAAKYSPPDGRIDITGRTTDGEVEIRVEDEGPGIPAEYRERVFDRFFRIDSSDRSGIPGTGLGLAICRGIIRNHGGRIWVEDRDGGGAAFVVRLPAARREAQEKTHEPGEAP